MSRYIDADALPINILDLRYYDGSRVRVVTAEDIEKAPSIDIVRCKECMYNPKDIGWVSCPMTGANTRKPDDFCSYGERRE